MHSPNYFFALFGEPNPPEKDRVESGSYHPHPKAAPFPTKPRNVSSIVRQLKPEFSV
jgi:hypothetical protein